MRRHVHARLRRNRIFTPPQTCHGLLLGIELKSRLAVESIRTTAGYRLFVAGEGEHGQLQRCQ
jgi:hypothetical protein